MLLELFIFVLPLPPFLLFIHFLLSSFPPLPPALPPSTFHPTPLSILPILTSLPFNPSRPSLSLSPFPPPSLLTAPKPREARISQQSFTVKGLGSALSLAAAEGDQECLDRKCGASCLTEDWRLRVPALPRPYLSPFCHPYLSLYYSTSP